MNQPCSVADLIDASYALGRSGDIGGAFQRAQEALDQARADGDNHATAAALLCLAYAQFRLGHYTDAHNLAEEGLTCSGLDAHNRIEAFLMLGMCATETSDLVAGEDFYRRAQDLSRQSGQDYLLQRSLTLLAAGVYIPRGQFDLALAADEEALDIARDRNLPGSSHLPLIGIAWASSLTGQYERARAALNALRQIAPEGSTAQGHYYNMAADLSREEGDLEVAMDLYGRARSTAEMTGDPGMSIWSRLGVSRCNRLKGNVAAAFFWANDACTIAARLGYLHFQGLALIERGRAASDTGDTSAAETDLRAAIQVLARLGAAFDLARARFFLAALLYAGKRDEAANAWHDSAQAIIAGEYAFFLERERTLAFPLVAAYLNHPDPAIRSLSLTLVSRLERVPPPPLRITMLGGFKVCQGKRHVEKRSLQKRRAGELLALLLLTPTHTLSFDQVIDALWPPKDASAAQALFHQATSALRRALEPELPEKFPSRYVVVEEGQVTLRLPSGSSIDFEDFDAYCLNGDWEAALTLYRGELLPDCLYADWSTVPRERIKRLFLRALLVTAHRQMEAKRPREVVDACHRILELDPWQEDAVLLGMQAYLMFNDRASALRLYRELERTLREELDTAPQAPLQELCQSLLHDPSES